MEDLETDSINIDNFSLPLNLGSLTTLESVSSDESKNKKEEVDAEFVVVEMEKSNLRDDEKDEGERDSSSHDGNHRHGISAGEIDGEDRSVVTVNEDNGDESKHRILTGGDGEEWQQVLTGGEDDDGQREEAMGAAERELTHQVVHTRQPLDSSRYTTQSIQTTGDDDDDDRSDLSDSESSCSASTYASHMSPDSEEGYDLVRTLRHYRRRRHRSSDSTTTDSQCSCQSCASKSNISFFGSEEGPPGGEATIYRRAAIWLESIKYLWGLFIYGMLAVTTIFTGAAVWAITREKQSDVEVGYKMLPWTLPLFLLTIVVIIVWRSVWFLLLKKGYGKGGLTVDRKNIIRFAQKKKLPYTVRGVIYAPVRPNPKGKNKPPVYEKVSYESEYDSSNYFDSDLEADGQYRRDITPWRDVEDPVIRDKRNIYSRKAWFRDVPIVWWELWTEPPRDF